MSQLPPGFEIISGGQAQAPTGPLPGAPPKPDKPNEPKTTYRQLTPAEAKERGLDPSKPYQISSEGRIDPLSNSDSKPTEYQSKSASFLGRMLMAEQQFGRVPADSRDARTVPGQFLHDTLPGVDATFNSSDRNSADNAARNFIAASLRQESGAAIGKEEYDNQYRIFFPMPGDTEQQLREKAAARAQAIEGFKIAAGPLAEQAIATVPAGAPTPEAPPPVGFDPGPGKIAPNTSGVRQEDDPALVQAGVKDAFAAMIAQSVEPGPAIQKLRELGVTDPIVLRDAAAQLDFRRKNPGVPLEKYSYPAIDDRATPLSGFEKAATAVGSSPIGAYAINAGQAVSANTLDNLSANPEQARAAIEVANAQNPRAATFGQVSGGVLNALTAEAALARFGMAPGMARGLAADASMGASSGAGAADGPGESRLAGAAKGGALAVAGNVAGNAVTRGFGKMVAPTGGSMNALYEAGVKPTLGQRMVDKGVLGRAVNATEEALQSFPLIGAAVQGSRQEARDQFQIGAFNEALKEVGEQLPKGMAPGTAPNAYAQKTFDRIYAEARSGMVMRGDDQLVADMDALDQQVATLAEGSAKRFNAIFKNVVDRRAKNGGGEVAGKEYKAMISDLGKQIRAIRSNPNGDMELASVLEDLQSTLDNTARRHSDPDAVKLLDAADAGYAKLVRIEDAARRAGGDAGTFTPAQFERSVQNNGGGVRSKAFLRGDALMQDYAEQGKGLVDRLPNSGTVDRGLAATALVGGTYVSPAIGAFLAAIGTAYAPGVRKGMQAALSPAGPKRKAIGEQLKKISRSASAASASTAVASQETSPGQ